MKKGAPAPRRFLALLLAVLLTAALSLPAAAAGTLGVDPTGRGEGYSAVLYNNPNGLPTSEANAIAETAEGFIWIGSYSGLIRYDGNTFERFDSTTGITSVVCLYTDSRDRLWIGTNDNGAAVLERGQLTRYGKADGLGSPSVRTIAEDASGTLYIGTAHGLSFVDPDDGTLQPLSDDRIDGEYIRALSLGEDGLLYGVTETGSVFTLRDRAVRSFYPAADLGALAILAVLPDPETPGQVYLGTERSVIYHGSLEEGPSSWQALDLSPLAYINDMQIIEGNLWVCADNGISLVEDGAAKRLETLPMNNSVEHIMTDYAGDLWFTSSRQGVLKIVPNQFTDLFEQYQLDQQVVNSTCVFEDQLFIGTDAGLTVVDGDGVVDRVPLTRAATASGSDLQIHDLLQLLSGCRIRSILRDEADRLWFSTYSKRALVCYDHGSATCYTSADGLPSDRVRAVAFREDGAVLAACSGGLAFLENGQVSRVVGEADGLGSTALLTVAVAPNGDVLLGTDGDGVYVLREEGLLHLDQDGGLPSDIIMRVKRDDERGLFWLVTSNALAVLSESYETTVIQKFPYSNNFDLYENSRGEMWVLSSNGVYVVPTEDLLANGEITPVFYSRDNGLPCTTTANSYSDVAEDGNLYISGNTGVVKVNIETPFESVDDVKMAVPYVEADGAFYYPDESGVITVPESIQKLTVYGFVFTYSLVNPQVTYTLEGFDQAGVTVSRSELTPVDYTNLPGGEYAFVMELKDSMGRGSKVLRVPIVKQLAFQEHWWVRLAVLVLGGLAVGLLVWLYFRRKTRALLQKQEENRLFIREMTQAFAKTIDMKDKYTNGHSTRVANYTAMLTRELGYDEETVEKYYNIALLHDIGKIGVPGKVLNKPGKLDDEEYQIIQSHSALGYDVLKDISIMPELAIGAGAHHERPDGKGYPNHLTGDQIPRVAQIIAVADTFDAMYSNRPYRNRMNFDKVVSVIREVSGTQLTPDVVDAFLRLVEKGEFRDPDDHGGGSTEVIDNVEKK